MKLGVKQPDLAAILPYQYAYNRFHGTPLYKTLPTRAEMFKYEPYLEKKEEKKSETPTAAEEERRKGKHAPETEAPEAAGGAVPSGDIKAEDAVAAVEKLDSGATTPEEAAVEEKPKTWWQDDDKDKKPVVTLAELEQEADGNLSKRMVKGFFIAVDKTFGWNDRLWYRTTGGLLAPTDRMWVNKPPEQKGIEWPEGAKEIYFMLSEKGVKYELSKDQKKAENKGKISRHAAVPLTGKTIEIGDDLYRESTEGYWVSDKQGVITKPGKRPDGVGADERWVDVNITTKTLVLFIGDKPVYAAVVSPGKRSRNKKKDHATPTGAWRIREKHIAVTMDGDGASGDLPYSIEDVPYVAYFKGSYALHGAFWHQNFGREMSHGCVNLAPQDAKYVFGWVEPRMPRGWHGVFASKDHVGSMVVIHE
ncbi:MAG: L,D-transpeptidase [Polyangiaceae bacterium]|nr:L,D-transpeptidase [Polyangiaceae bacterium]